MQLDFQLWTVNMDFKTCLSAFLKTFMNIDHINLFQTYFFIWTLFPMVFNMDIVHHILNKATFTLFNVLTQITLSPYIFYSLCATKAWLPKVMFALVGNIAEKWIIFSFSCFWEKELVLAFAQVVVLFFFSFSLFLH